MVALTSPPIRHTITKPRSHRIINIAECISRLFQNARLFSHMLIMDINSLIYLEINSGPEALAYLVLLHLCGQIFHKTNVSLIPHSSLIQFFEHFQIV